ncbi:MAG: zinc metallopeptidase [Gammaproteobacteria bacterium]|nr:zinc metallopeptidase [Gammaproteobacteria bacterium]
MRLEDQRESQNVEDRRGEGYSGGGGIGARHVGIGSIVIALAASYFLGVSPSTVLNILSGVDGGTSAEAPARAPPANDTQAHFVSKILADTEDTWRAIFQASGATYAEPKLVLFTGETPTACGTGQTAMGPFYCPGDQKVYIDLAFYRELQERFHAPGEFAEAYVIAHEVGHHVQNLLGTADKVHAAQARGGRAEANALSVRMELQADCYAGVWGQRADAMKHILEPGEIEQALAAATAIGDDRLQKQAQGYAVPESFTHGTSEQRVRWFKRGIESGDMKQCDTFNAASL